MRRSATRSAPPRRRPPRTGSVARRSRTTAPTRDLPCSSSHLGPDRTGTVRCYALAFLSRSDEHCNLPKMEIVAQQLVRLGDALKAHRPPQYRANLGLLDQLVGLVGLPRVGE